MFCQFNSKVSVKKIKEQHKCHIINFQKHRSFSNFRNYKSTHISQLDSLLSETLREIYANICKSVTLRKKCPYSARMRENASQNNSKYGHFLRSVNLMVIQEYLGISNRNKICQGWI